MMDYEAAGHQQQHQQAGDEQQHFQHDDEHHHQQAAVLADSNVIVKVPDSLPKETLLEQFATHFCESVEENKAVSLYTHNANRTVNYYDGSKFLVHKYSKISEIEEGYQQFPMQGIHFTSKDTTCVNDAIIINLIGKCSMNNEKKIISINIIQRVCCNIDKELSFLISDESISIFPDSSYPVVSSSSINNTTTFNFSNNISNKNSTVRADHAPKFQNTNKSHQHHFSTVKHGAIPLQQTSRNHYQNSHPSAADDHLSHESHFDDQALSMHSHKSEKNFAASKMFSAQQHNGKHSVPLTSQSSEQIKKEEDNIARHNISTYAASMNNKVKSSIVNDLMNPDQQHSSVKSSNLNSKAVNGEQSMPSNSDKFNGGRSGFKDRRGNRGERTDRRSGPRSGDRGSPMKRRGGDYNSRNDSKDELYVSPLKSDFTKEDIQDAISSAFGEVLDVSIKTAQKNGNIYAHVKMSEADAAKARQAGEITIKGEKIFLKARSITNGPMGNIPGGNGGRSRNFTSNSGPRKYSQGTSNNNFNSAAPSNTDATAVDAEAENGWD